MLDFGWSELLVIAVVAILVVGPRELPKMLRNFGKTVGQVRRMAGEFQSQFNDALKEAELDEVRRGIEEVRSATSGSALKDSINPLKKAGDELKASIEQPTVQAKASPTKPGPSPSPSSSPGNEKAAAPDSDPGLADAASGAEAAAKPAPEPMPETEAATPAPAKAAKTTENAGA